MYLDLKCDFGGSQGAFCTDHWAAVTHLRMQVALTLALGGAAMWIIVAKEHGADDKKWAYGTLGTLLGYWVKG